MNVSVEYCLYITISCGNKFLSTLLTYNILLVKLFYLRINCKPLYNNINNYSVDMLFEKM